MNNLGKSPLFAHKNIAFSTLKHSAFPIKTQYLWVKKTILSNEGSVRDSSGGCPYGQKLNKIYSKSNKSIAQLFERFGKICSISARKGTQQTFKSKIHGFSKSRHLRVVRNGVFTRSDGIYKWMVTAERVVDNGGTGVRNVWNNPKQSLRKHYLDSTQVQNRLYLHPNETLLGSQPDFTCTKRHLWRFPNTQEFPFLPISIFSQPLTDCEFS